VRRRSKLVAEGHTSQQIADLRVISPKTVLTRYAIRVGLIEP
jgi:DNA-binding CsgD family transcriptional regulator